MFDYNEALRLLRLSRWRIARRVRGADNVEDVLSECSLALWKHVQAGTEVASLSGFIAGIIRNQVWIWLKKNARYRQCEAERILSDNPSIEEQIDSDRRAASVLGALDRLANQSMREIARLSFVDGYSPSEIERMGYSHIEVRNSRHRAKQRVAEYLT